MAVVTDPETYQALAYSPPNAAPGQPLPLLVVLHGAAVNARGVEDLANPLGEHAGLAPSLLAAGRAPHQLADCFAVVAPFACSAAGAAAGRQSFYEEPRGKLLRFVEWVCSAEGRRAGCPNVDPQRVFLFGFSDGATVAVELATTRRFAGAVVASYGFTGALPPKAVERLQGVPLWVFHCADDAIFPVACSDRLVRTLRAATRNGESGPDRPPQKAPTGGASASAGAAAAAGGDAEVGSSAVRYTRFDRDQEGFIGNVRGHSTGITATRTPEVFDWLLALPALRNRES